MPEYYAIRVNEDKENYLYWSNNTDHGAGWRRKIDKHSRFNWERVIQELIVIQKTLSEMPPITLVPAPAPMIKVCRRDAELIKRAVRWACERTSSESIKQDFQELVTRLSIVGIDE